MGKLGLPQKGGKRYEKSIVFTVGVGLPAVAGRGIARFRFCRGDWLLLGTTLALTAVCLTALALNPASFTCYPAILWPPLSPLTAAAYGSYGLLVFLPTILEAKEALKWRSLLSKI